MFRTRATVVSLAVVSLLSLCALNTLTVSADTEAAPPRKHQPDSRAFHPLDEIRRADLLLGSLGTVLTSYRTELDLSEEQYASLTTIWIEHEKGRLQAENKVQNAGMEVIALSNDMNTDLATIEAAMIRFSSELALLQMQSVKTLRALRAVVTAEQLEKWENLLRSKVKQKDGKGSV